MGGYTPFREANAFFGNLYDLFAGLNVFGVSLIPEWLAYFVAGFLVIFIVINVVVITTTVGTWVERRLIGRIQSRLGPNRWGPFGLLTPVADALKLLTKEDTRPEGVDGWVFNLAPLVFILGPLLVFAVIPFGKNTYVADLNIGILFIIAVTTVPTIAMFMAGWGSGNRYSLFGAMRGVAQLVSYEVPLVLSIVGVLLLAGSLSLVDIVESQRIPFILIQPLGFFIFIVAISAEMNRSPFDIVEADSELVAGFHTEYSGMKWGTFQLAEFIAPFGAASIITTLFLKGWEGPVLPSHLWFFIKVWAIWFILLWVRATLPRLRVDQIMALAWKFLFPLGLINLFITAGLLLIWEDPTTIQLWAMGGINWVIALVCLVVSSHLMSDKLTARPPLAPVPGRSSGRAQEAR
ncbi:MAG: NADH-quinone oxidoreductase subunit NuoH [Chloroflexota bacterium]|nr:NADH-quinone oxidoreductase subunit NuoH [Chloroflexota bacterium]MDE2942071.1 NADH-quinone oxidoreductase subunit NuoH [Chloroflexota bacterium]MDE3268149.1 NADH-quinone oxidoreductase subunit NuoH [Chloroflexota bacterium]